MNFRHLDLQVNFNSCDPAYKLLPKSSLTLIQKHLNANPEPSNKPDP